MLKSRWPQACGIFLYLYMTKKELRTHYKALRQVLTLNEIEQKSLAIANRLLGLDIWNKTYYHLFLSMENQKEVHTDVVLNILAGKDKEVVVSRSDFETCTMVHYLLTDNTKLALSTYGIPEPVDGLEVPSAKMDVVFVPLLAFDIKGHRVGYGKGFYDRFLNECRPDVIRVGLSFFEAAEGEIPHNDTDIALDFCVTPERVYAF
ncbi:5-formyltetrahydrofolate cyclo-ligase [Flavobacterium akiainvivens]|nr:5-formyltetrahydrofolate cyclo-ligase [Flavobacterium akiainvivens]